VEGVTLIAVLVPCDDIGLLFGGIFCSNLGVIFRQITARFFLMHSESQSHEVKETFEFVFFQLVNLVGVSTNGQMNVTDRVPASITQDYRSSPKTSERFSIRR
jgi:hypothetical protein